MKLDSASIVPRGTTGACPSFTQALSRGDLDSAAACFARDGCLITPDATAVLVLRWIEGAWKLVIAAPWGWSATAL